MKPGQIIGAAIALFFLVEFLVGDENGVLTNLHENSGQVAAAQVQSGPAAKPATRPGAGFDTSSSPWDIAENGLTIEAGDFAGPETPASEGPADEPLAVPARPPLHPQAGSPEFPYVPLPKPQLTVAGARISYPPVAER